MNNQLIRSSTIGLLIVLAGFLVAYQFVEPAPPNHITLATGGPNGAYHAFGLELNALLAEQGIELELRNTAGSVENAALLAAGEVDLALIQGGTGLPTALVDGEPVGDALRGLASLYFEPLWGFVRLEEGAQASSLSRLQQLQGLRVNRGAPGSGTRALVDELLTLNAMEASGFSEHSTADASQQLLAGELDAVFVVGGATSPEVEALLRAEGIGLMNLERSEAYHLQHRYLSPLLLPAGAIDLAENRPGADVEMIGVTAMLASREDLHPALVDLVLLSAPAIVGGDGLFQRAGEFPTARFLSLPVGDEAARFHKRGPSFLQRYLPFWAATLIDRLIVMLVPLVALMLPLMRLFPPIYRWRVRSRIYKWYADLRDIEARMDSGESGDALIAEVQRLEDEVKRVDTPLSYADELYHLRGHIELVQARIEG